MKPAKAVRAGDIIEVSIGTARWKVAVTAIADRRGPASVAATMYAETPESRVVREQHALERRLARPLGALPQPGRLLDPAFASEQELLV